MNLSASSPSAVRSVGILLFPEVEVLDFAGPFEVFSVAARIAPRLLGLPTPPFAVFTVARDAQPVCARHGLIVVPGHGFADAPPIDVLIVPGGVVDQPLGCRTTLDWLRQTAATAGLTASVCTGAFLLAELGLLDGRRATTHWEDLADLRAAYPRVSVIGGVPYVDEGAVVTSAGISAGIGMSLHLVGRLVSPELARLTARQMQYDWRPEAG
ncbi:DJ-1/PfpI family protein [Novosphingobium flavum]|uniref:DJ-1/PfpI family protein n=1 Tax=Novosphingobium aerophilum TaxID=2839843 RepID=A0A7X1F626_9SPHN|nr:DJ-1/PfpI family protein [Novosphingobium aerophilum]MBC2651026.1 DJ-1/PfpI family protein [Novosphingobium aerophilum]MBC2663213.1 DJ-1/PfpI family protein [Novosphingobium aerophilum]